MFLQSIIVYTLFAWLMFFNAKLAIYERPKIITGTKPWRLPCHYCVCVFIFILVSGIRWDVGVDYMSYLEDYLAMQNGSFVERVRGIEPGYLFISQLCAKLGFHYSVYFAVLAFFEIYFVLLAFRNDRKIVPILLVLVVMGGYYFSWMNGIRQNIVACSFVFACKYIVDRNWKAYFIWVAIAYTMHTSALLLIPFYFLIFDKTIWNKTWVNIGLFIACVVIGMTPTFVDNLTRLEGLLSFIGYDYYSDMMSDITDSSNFRSYNIGPRMIVNICTYITCILLYGKVRLWVNSEKFDFMFKLFFIGICGYYLFVNTSGLFLRPMYYFQIFALPLTAYTLCYFKMKRKNIMYLSLIIISLSFTFLSCYADSKAKLEDRRSQLYQFCFNHWNGI